MTEGLTDWGADWQQLQVGRVDSAFPLFAGNFGAHQLKLWKLIKLKRLPRGHSRGASQPNVWQCLLSCASLGQLQVKTSQHARQPFFLGPKGNLLLCIQAEIKAPCHKAERDKVQATGGAGQMEAKLSHAPQIEIVSLGLRLSKATTTTREAQQKFASWKRPARTRA